MTFKHKNVTNNNKHWGLYFNRDKKKKNSNKSPGAGAPPGWSVGAAAKSCLKKNINQSVLIN